jgi:peptidylprolyl isomerase
LIRNLLAAFAAFAILAVAPAYSQTSDPENTLVMETSKGRVVIQMRPDLAPRHVEQIRTLAQQNFYDGIVFHRVIPGFMAQTGDPTGTGMGSSDLPNIPAEFTDTNFARGVVGMARSSDPNSANSQFFIMFAEGSFLNNQYTVWGEVIEGMDVVDSINAGEPPADPDRIVTLRLASQAN